MAPEIGYFALLLAFFISITQSAMPFVAARRSDLAVAAFVDVSSIHVHCGCICVLDLRVRHFRFFGRGRNSQLAYCKTTAVQDIRSVGEPRGIHVALGPHSVAVWRRGGGIWAQFA